MIDYLHGRLVFKSPTYIRVEINGIGYGVHISLSTYDNLADIGEDAKVYTSLHLKDDIFQLFGFGTIEEKELFEMLITVSGIGPRLALRILSGLSVPELREAISQENLPVLTAVPGVGKKTAQRLFVELKEKIGVVDLTLEGKESKAPGSGNTQTIKQAVSALVSLGCKPADAAKAVKEAKAYVPAKVSLETLVKEALKYL